MRTAIDICGHTVEQWDRTEHCFFGVFDPDGPDHAEISIERSGDWQQWYIQVRNDIGAMYLGYWENSAGKPLEEAIYEALRGSTLISDPTEESAPRDPHQGGA